MLPLIGVGSTRISYDSLNEAALDLEGARSDISEIDFFSVGRRLLDRGWLSGRSIMSNGLSRPGSEVNRRDLV